VDQDAGAGVALCQSRRGELPAQGRKCGKKCRETMGLLPCEGVAIDAN